MVPNELTNKAVTCKTTLIPPDIPDGWVTEFKANISDWNNDYISPYFVSTNTPYNNTLHAL